MPRFQQERPPRGYDTRDFPLPHEFNYHYSLSLTSTKNGTYMPYIHMYGTAALLPETIEVNPDNSNFAVETGSVTQPRSKIARANIITTFSLTEGFLITDALSHLTVLHQNIFGCFEDAWSPKDRKTGSSIATILGVIDEPTNEDVIPLYNNIKCVLEEDYPLSTINQAEVVGNAGLNTDAKMECATIDLDTYFDAVQYYSISNKMKTVAGRVKKVTLTKNHPTHSIFESRFIPRSCQNGQPYTFLYRMFLQ